jgi:hypothetical protein
MGAAVASSALCLGQTRQTGNRLQAKSEIQLDLLVHNVCYIPVLFFFIYKFFNVEILKMLKFNIIVITENVSGPHHKALQVACWTDLV